MQQYSTPPPPPPAPVAFLWPPLNAFQVNINMLGGEGKCGTKILSKDTT